MENTTSNLGKAAKQNFNNAAGKADDYAASIATGAERVWDRAKDVEKSLASSYQTVRDAALDGYDVTTEAVKKYPMSTILAATATGFLAGILLARRK